MSRLPDLRRICVVPIFEPSLFPHLHMRVLACGDALIVDELRAWVESAERAPKNVCWVPDERDAPHVVLICGAIRAGRDRLLERIAEWRSGGAFVIRFASAQMREAEPRLGKEANATIESPRAAGARLSETDDVFRIVGAARGLLHPLLSHGGIGVDAGDIFGVLKHATDGLVRHFDASEGIAAVMDAHPMARGHLARTMKAFLATTYGQTSDWLNDCCLRMEACRAAMAQDADVVAALNFKRGNGSADVELYVPN